MNTSLTHSLRTSLERWWNNYQGPRSVAHGVSKGMVCPPGPIPRPQPGAGSWGWAQVGTGCVAETGQGCGELEIDPAVAAASLGHRLMALEGWAEAARPGGAH